MKGGLNVCNTNLAMVCRGKGNLWPQNDLRDLIPRLLCYDALQRFQIQKQVKRLSVDPVQCPHDGFPSELHALLPDLIAVVHLSIQTA